MSVVLQAPIEGDIPELAALHVLCWQQAYSGILPADFLASMSVQQRVDTWKHALQDSSRFVQVALSDGSIVGFSMSGPARNVAKAYADGEIFAINILQTHYRKGIGRMLFEAAVDDWGRRDGRSIALLVLTENHRARRFYEALGGVACGTHQSDANGVAFHETIYKFDDLGTSD